VGQQNGGGKIVPLNYLVAGRDARNSQHQDQGSRNTLVPSNQNSEEGIVLYIAIFPKVDIVKDIFEAQLHSQILIENIHHIFGDFTQY